MTIKFDLKMSADGESVDVLMHGPIGSSIFQEGITSQQVSLALAKAPFAKNIQLKLNSPGGSVWEGMAIRNMLAEHPARVTAHVEGLAASCASVICMAADEIVMYAGSRMMIHESHRLTQGDVREHEKAIAGMKSINTGAAEIYAARSGQDLDTVQQMMSDETWLTPDEALKFGFADRVVAAKGGTAPAMSFDLKPYHYRHVPSHWATQMSGGQEPPTNTEKPMSFARIAMALGLSDGAEEAAVMAAIDRQKQQTHRGELMLSELRQITGKDTPDAVLGAVRAYAEANTQLAAAREEVTQLRAATEKQERETLIAQDAANPKGRRLTPAVAKLYANKPVAELKAYLEVAYVIPGTAKLSAVADGGHQPNMSGDASGKGDNVPDANGGDVEMYDGKSWEQLKPIQRHNLKATDPDRYLAVRTNYEQRMQRV